MFRNDVEYQDYPAWTKSVNDVNAQVGFPLSHDMGSQEPLIVISHRITSTMGNGPV